MSVSGAPSWRWSRPTATGTASYRPRERCSPGAPTALGVAVLEEALALRAAGITGPACSPGCTPPAPTTPPRSTADIELSVNAEWALAEIVAAARATGRTARVQLFADTGLSREGATPADWPGLVAAAARAQADGEIAVVGLWSHMAYADAPTHPTIGAQVRVFEEAVAHRPRRRADRRAPAPGQLRGHDRAARHLVRPRPPRRRPVRAGPAGRQRGATTACARR